MEPTTTTTTTSTPVLVTTRFGGVFIGHLADDAPATPARSS